MADQRRDGDGPVGLFLDYGGVLTSPVGASFAVFERSIGVPVGRSFELLLEASRDASDGGMIGALERGEMPAEEFDARLSALLTDAGYEVPASGLLSQLFAGMQPTGGLWDIARQVRAHGLPVGLLSNSWGTDIYPREQLEEHFDVLVISAEVGLRKPDPAIYELACDRLGLAPEHCAFVDDLPHNVEVARQVGMFGVHHDGDEVAVVSALTGFLGVELSLP